MSRGKPRHAVPQDSQEADEQARMRQLTRELHEAAQAAKEAARELRSARAETASTVDALIREQISEWDMRLGGQIQETAGLVKDRMEQLRDHEAQLLGCADQEQMLLYIVDGLHESLMPVLTEQVTRDVERSVGSYVKNALRTLGRDPGQPDIIVTTKDMVDHPANKGRVIIDMT